MQSSLAIGGNIPASVSPGNDKKRRQWHLVQVLSSFYCLSIQTDGSLISASLQFFLLQAVSSCTSKVLAGMSYNQDKTTSLIPAVFLRDSVHKAQRCQQPSTDWFN